MQPHASIAPRLGLAAAALAMLATACGDSPDGPSGRHDHDDPQPPSPGVDLTLGREDVATAYEVEEEWLISPAVVAEGGASRVGALVQLIKGGALPTLEAQGMDGDTPVTEWIPLMPTFSEEDHHVAVAELGRVSTGARLRIAARAIDELLLLRWSAVIPETVEDNESLDDSVDVLRRGLRRELQGIGVTSREAWGARATRCRGRDSRKNRMAVHYTVTPAANPGRQVRSIQAFHMDTRGWCDVGYHFLVGIDGSVYEGRPIELRGAHVGNHNSGNIGVSFIGCFHGSGCERWPPLVPPDAMINAGGRLLGALSDIYGIALNGTKVKGHRDHSGASTSCPGDNLHARIPRLLQIGNGQQPVPEPDPTPTPEPDPDPEPPPGGCGSLSCGRCETAAACNWCAARAGCAADDEWCAWGGEIGNNACWSQMWPCATASCWDPRAQFERCGNWEIQEDFASGRFSVHRYWAELPGGPMTLTLERTGGSFEPSLIITDRAGRPIYGGEAAALHPQVNVLNSISGRSAARATVTLEAQQNIGVLIYVSGWRVPGSGFSATMPRDSRYRLRAAHQCGPAPEPTPEPTPTPEPEPEPTPTPEPTPGPSCGGMSCGGCGGAEGCDWCAARGSCSALVGDPGGSCTWAGRVGDEACWDALWPCWLASCWEPTAELNNCGSWQIDEDFSSGRYSVHRYNMDLHDGGPTTIRYALTGGSFAPALVVTDRAGALIYGGEVAQLHSAVSVVSAEAGREGQVAEVTLNASRDMGVFVYVTGWGVLDEGFDGSMPRSSEYRLSATHSCR